MVYNKNSYIVKKISSYDKAKKYIIRSCLTFFIIGIVIFSFYIFGNGNQAIKFVSEYKNKKLSKEIEKVMTNPSIKFEYKDNEFYDIQAVRGVHKTQEEATLFDVYVEGKSMNITAGKLLVSDNGDNLHFTEKPILVLKTTKNK